MLAGFSNVVMGLYRLCREQQVGAFQDAAFELIKSVVPFDSGLWMTGTLDFVTGEATFHTHHLHRQPPQLLVDWAQTKDSAVFSRKVLGNPGITHGCVTSRELGPELAAHARRYHIEHILATDGVGPASLHELISIYRADLDKPFTEDERLFQQAIVPHLVETWRLNRMLHLFGASQLGGAVPCFSAAADVKGVLHLIEPSFEQLLQHEWPNWRGVRLPDGLLAEIENKRECFVGESIVIGISSLANQILLRGRKKTVVDALSQRKREVADLFATGHTHKEIATLLSLSPATVRNYLNSIYLTLGIGSKAELANILKDHA